MVSALNAAVCLSMPAAMNVPFDTTDASALPGAAINFYCQWLIKQIFSRGFSTEAAHSQWNASGLNSLSAIFSNPNVNKSIVKPLFSASCICGYQSTMLLLGVTCRLRRFAHGAAEEPHGVFSCPKNFLPQDLWRNDFCCIPWKMKSGGCLGHSHMGPGCERRKQWIKLDSWRKT